MKPDLHLDEELEAEEPCCQEHFALSMVPAYSNKPDWVHVLPIPDLKGYEQPYTSKPLKFQSLFLLFIVSKNIYTSK